MNINQKKHNISLAPFIFISLQVILLSISIDSTIDLIDFNNDIALILWIDILFVLFTYFLTHCQDPGYVPLDIIPVTETSCRTDSKFKQTQLISLIKNSEIRTPKDQEMDEAISITKNLEGKQASQTRQDKIRNKYIEKQLSLIPTPQNANNHTKKSQFNILHEEDPEAAHHPQLPHKQQEKEQSQQEQSELQNQQQIPVQNQQEDEEENQQEDNTEDQNQIEEQLNTVQQQSLQEQQQYGDYTEKLQQPLQQIQQQSNNNNQIQINFLSFGFATPQIQKHQIDVNDFNLKHSIQQANTPIESIQQSENNNFQTPPHLQGESQIHQQINISNIQQEEQKSQIFQNNNSNNKENLPSEYIECEQSYETEHEPHTQRLSKMEDSLRSNEKQDFALNSSDYHNNNNINNSDANSPNRSNNLIKSPQNNIDPIQEVQQLDEEDYQQKQQIGDGLIKHFNDEVGNPEIIVKVLMTPAFPEDSSTKATTSTNQVLTHLTTAGFNITQNQEEGLLSNSKMPQQKLVLEEDEQENQEDNQDQQQMQLEVQSNKATQENKTISLSNGTEYNDIPLEQQEIQINLVRQSPDKKNFKAAYYRCTSNNQTMLSDKNTEQENNFQFAESIQNIGKYSEHSNQNNPHQNENIDNKDKQDFYVEKRYCTLCNIEQPLRSKHCKDCNRCVATYDHHCPWLGTCIGEKNRCKFYWFLVSQLAEIVIVGVKFTEAFIEKLMKDSLVNNIIQLLAILIIGCFFFMVFILLGYHTYLAFYNLTTWESVSWHKISYLRDWPEDQGSPFYINCLQSIKQYCTFRWNDTPLMRWKFQKKNTNICNNQHQQF